MKVRPTGYYILLKEEVIEDKTESGILLPTNHVEREQGGIDEGVIVAFGPTAFHGVAGIPEKVDGMTLSAENRAEYWGCKVGDRVIFNRYDGKGLQEKVGEHYRLVQDQHLISVIEG